MTRKIPFNENVPQHTALYPNVPFLHSIVTENKNESQEVSICELVRVCLCIRKVREKVKVGREEG